MYINHASTTETTFKNTPNPFELLKHLFIGPRDCFIGNREGCAFAKKRQPPSIRLLFQNKPFGVFHVVLPNFQFPVIFDQVLDCFILILLVIFNNSKFVLGPRKFYCKRSFFKTETKMSNNLQPGMEKLFSS